jgi:hypothetical protein
MTLQNAYLIISQVQIMLLNSELYDIHFSDMFFTGMLLSIKLETLGHGAGQEEAEKEQMQS